MTRPPPTSTLFPYTTLFRSRKSFEAAGKRSTRVGDQLERLRVDLGGARADRRRDRKSTRLNSSHMSISYAVFCLKKKKNTSGFLLKWVDSARLGHASGWLLR